MTIPLPSLPAGWKQSRLRFVAAINPSKTEISHLDPSSEVSFVPMEAVGEDASLDASRLMPISEVSNGYTYFRNGDILIAKITPCFENGKVALAQLLVGGVGFGSTEFHVIRPGPSLDARFLFYVINSSLFRDFGTASMYGAGGQKRVPTNFVADFPLPVPPLREQEVIADFLDNEIVKIERLIQRQVAFVAHLKEHSGALITEAVTHGRDPLEIEPSTGSILRPVRLRVAIRRIEQGWSPQCDNYPAVADEWGVLKVGSVNGATFNPDENKALPSDLTAVQELEIKSGDLLVSRANTLELVGSAAVVKSTRAKLLLCDKLYRITVRDDRILPEFLSYVMRSRPARHYIEAAATGASSSMKNIGQDVIRNLPLFLPPIDEQHEVVQRLDGALAKIGVLHARSDEMIERLREHRTALITAAITGQLGVAVANRHPIAAASNDNRHALRVVVGAEIVSRQGSAKNFGRVKLQKLLYLAEVHAGIHELAGNYVRQAAGPLAPDLLSETERGMEAAGFYRTVPPTNETDGYTYSRIGKAGAHGDQFAALLGDRAPALTQLIDRFKDYDKRQVEAITTLYAVWNDALLDGETPTDDRIIRGVLEEWHPEKKDKFTGADLKPWLAWMRRNGVVPTGTGSRTKLDRLFV